MKSRRWRRAAFIYYNQMGFPGQFESVPLAFNTLTMLADECDEVDAFLWEPSDEIAPLFPENVRFDSRKLPQESRFNWLLIPFGSLYRHGLRARFGAMRGYDVVFGLGQIGCVAGAWAAKASRCPFVCINDEFPDTVGSHYKWTRLEREAASKASVLVVPDRSRLEPLLKQLDLRPGVRAILPNSPLPNEGTAEIDWRQRLGLKPEQRAFLYAGSLHDWMQVPEIMQSVGQWPENTALVLHGPRPEPFYRRQLSHLEINGRIFWIDERLSLQELNSLVKFSVAMLALYRNVEDNMFYMGHASGKIMRSLACGTPVITSDFPSLDFVATNSLGRQIAHVSEISAAISEILEQRETMSENCLDYFKENCRFEKAWREMLDLLPKH